MFFFFLLSPLSNKNNQYTVEKKITGNLKICNPCVCHLTPSPANKSCMQSVFRPSSCNHGSLLLFVCLFVCVCHDSCFCLHFLELSHRLSIQSFYKTQKAHRIITFQSLDSTPTLHMHFNHTGYTAGQDHSAD